MAEQLQPIQPEYFEEKSDPAEMAHRQILERQDLFPDRRNPKNPDRLFETYVTDLFGHIPGVAWAEKVGQDTDRLDGTDLILALRSGRLLAVDLTTAVDPEIRMGKESRGLALGNKPLRTLPELGNIARATVHMYFEDLDYPTRRYQQAHGQS